MASRASVLAEQVLGGSRLALSKSLSLCESRLREDRLCGEEVARILYASRRDQPSWRIGITGPPGAGKSTFIEALGLLLVSKGMRVGVLCVDPSSSLTGGSVLGDRTRMGRLAMMDGCYVRGGAAGGDEGGLNRSARHQLQVLEGAHEVVLVETVGVGQTEHEAAALADTMVLLLPPASGDGLQGMKRGITEHADVVLINKSDGGLEEKAARAASDYRSSMRLQTTRREPLEWTPPVLRVSAETGMGMEAALTVMERHRSMLGDVRKRRAKNEWDLLWTMCGRRAVTAMKDNAHVKNNLDTWKDKVFQGTVTLDLVCDEIIQSSGLKEQ